MLNSDSEFHFTKALVRGISSHFAKDSLRLEEPEEAINVIKAKEQWSNYVSALKGLGVEIIQVPAHDRYPDCVFVADLAVVREGTALITRPGHASRRGEEVEVRNSLEKLGLNIVDMVEPGRMDAGDVLFTGREFFIGLSSRTNKEGIEFLAKTFPKYPVTPVEMERKESVLHLTSCLTMAGPELIVIAEGKSGDDAWKVIEEQGKFKYTKLSVADIQGANVLYINGTIVHQSASFVPESVKVLNSVNCPKVEVDMSELAKADGSVTCCSLLIN